MAKPGSPKSGKGGNVKKSGPPSGQPKTAGKGNKNSGRGRAKTPKSY